GTISGDVVIFDAEFVIEVLARAKDHLEVRLPFRGAAIEKAEVEGPQSWLGPLEEGSGLRLLLRGEGARTVKLRLATNLNERGAVKGVDFGAPRAGASSLSLRVGEEVEMENVQDSLPATVEKISDGGYEIRASGGSAEHFVVMFKPKVEVTGAAAETRLSVSENVDLSVSAQSASARIAMRVELLAGSAKAVVVQMPEKVRLVGVSGAFVKDWSEADTQRRVTVTLVREVTEPFDLTLDAQFEPGEANAALVVPEFRVPSAVRESGMVVILPDEGIAVWPEKISGLEAVSIGGRGGAGARGFRFVQPGWELVLARRPVLARIRSEAILLYEVTDEFVRLKSKHVLTVAGRGVFGVTFEVPEGYELRDAGPPELVSGFRQEGRRVEVNFRGEQSAQMNVDLRLERRRGADESKVLLEPIGVIGAEEDAGSVVLATPLALRSTELAATGLEATDVRMLREQLKPLLTAELVPVLGYRYFTPVFHGVAGLERQRTRLTCETALLASVEPSLMRIDATLNYSVEFSATDEFQLLVPASAGDDVRFSGADIKEKVRSASGAKASSWDELTTWTIRLQRRVIGPYRLFVSFDVPLPEAKSGEVQTVTVPTVRAKNVARETGHVAVSRGENLEVRVAGSKGLEVRDVKELPPMLANAFLGFRYFDPEGYSLQLELVRHELETVLGALVRRMHIETVVNDQREAVHEAHFEIQNNRAQYLELRLPEGMEIWSAFVRGMPVRPMTREKDGARLIELTKSETKDQAFRVRLILRETLKGGELGTWGSLRFAPPEPLNIPVLRTTWKIYLPRDYRYLDFGGTMRLETGGKPPWVEPTAEKLLTDLPTEMARGVAQNMQRPGEVQVGVAYNASETEDEKRARLQGAALEIPIVREGVPFEFSKLSGVGTITVDYWKRKPLLLLQGGIALALFILLMVAMGFGKRPVIGFVAALASFIAAS
ncbi:MAG: hypothetical protein V2A74_04185, partial [bacterium]